MIIKREGKFFHVYKDLKSLFHSTSLIEAQEWMANNSEGKLVFSEYYQSVIDAKKFVR